MCPRNRVNFKSLPQTLKELCQCPCLLNREGLGRPPVHLFSHLVHLGEQAEPLLSDGDIHAAPVLLVRLATNQPPLAEFLHEAGRVCGTVQHPLLHVAQIVRASAIASKDPQDVVLLARDIELPELLLKDPIQPVAGEVQVRDGLCVRVGELLLFDLIGKLHGLTGHI